MSLLLEEIAVPVKHSPMSEGIATAKKPKQLAIILETALAAPARLPVSNTVRSRNVCSGFWRTTHRLAELSRSVPLHRGVRNAPVKRA
jgi:hypothetical protein